MKKYINPILSLFILLGIVACSDDNGMDFAGSDAFITSLRLEKEGEVYQAVITDKALLLSLPVGVSLSGNVTAEMQWSENATVIPDPAGITDWSEERQFVVTAYDGTTNTYKYTIETEPVVLEGDITLTTQTEVNRLGEQQPVVVKGNLLIQSADSDPVTDLSPLATLTQVVYSLDVQSSFAGTTLQGLHNLEKVGGLSIGGEVLETVDFPNLSSVQLDLAISSGSLKEINFPKLTEVGKSLLLVHVEVGDVVFDKLETIGGDLQVVNAGVQSLSFSVLESIEGELSLTTLSALKKLSLPSLEYAGDLTINNLSGVEEVAFPVLREVSGRLYFNNCSFLETLSFDALKSTGTLYFDSSASNNVKEIKLPSLEKVNGGITWYCYGTPALLSFSLPSLQEVNGDFNFRLNNKNTLTEFLVPALKRVSGYFHIRTTSTAVSNNSLLKIDASSLTSAGEVQLLQLKGITSFETFKNVIPALESSTWKVTNCGYNPTYANMVEGKYSADN